MLTIIILFTSISLLIYYIILMGDHSEDPLLEEEYLKQKNNQLTLAIPVVGKDNFFELFNYYEKSTYIKKEIIYCIHNMSDEEFASVNLAMQLFEVPYMNFPIKVKEDFSIYYSNLYPKVHIIRYNGNDYTTIYNTVINLTANENIILTKANVYIPDESLRQINYNYNVGYELQTGIAISMKNIISFDKDEYYIKIPFGAPSSYRLIRQIEKLIYDKNSDITVGGVEHEICACKRSIIIEEGGFIDKRYALDDFIVKLVNKHTYKDKLDTYILGIYIRDSFETSVKQIYNDKYKAVYLMNKHALKPLFIKPKLAAYKYFYKKFLRFYGAYLNGPILILLFISIIYDVKMLIPFTILKLILFIISAVILILQVYLYFEQEYRTYINIDYIPMSKLSLNTLYYVIVARNIALIFTFIAGIDNLRELRRKND